MAGSSPTIPLWDAIGQRINNGPNPPDELLPGWPRYYIGRPEPTNGKLPPPGYYLFGMVSENPDDLYNGPRGAAGLVRIHCWAKNAHGAERLADWLKFLLHQEPLSLDGHRITDGGFISKAGPFAGPPGVDGRPDSFQTEVSYDVTTGEV